MAHRSRPVLVLVALALSAGHAARAQNAVVNGDFAASLAGWNTSPAEVPFTATQVR